MMALPVGMNFILNIERNSEDIRMNDMMKDLEDLKKEIESAKSDKIRLEGERDGLNKRLRNEFNCRTLAAAKKKLADLKKMREKTEAAAKDKYEKLKGDYEW